jgi:hypothetical protein
VSVQVYDQNWNYLFYTYEYFNLIGASQIFTTPYDGNICPNDEIEFYLPGQNSGGLFSWNFGDGQSDNGNQAGIYHA